MIDDNKMRIGVDGYNLALPHGTGVATYARTLVAAINGAGWKVDLLYGIPVAQDAPVDVRETLFYGRLSEEQGNVPLPQTISAKIRRFLLTPEVRKMVEVPRSGHVITTDLADRVPPFDRLFTRGRVFSVCARYFRRYGKFMTLRIPNPPPIMHWTYPLPLRLEGAQNLYTIHDLVPLRLPHTTLEDKRYYHRLIQTCIETAAHIVTVSEASKQDIISLFAADPAKVTNTYQAFDPPEPDESGSDLDRRLKRLFDLDRNGYFLFFGAIEPKKNLGRLIEAYLRSEIDTPLIVVGSTGWKSDQELRLLRGGTGTALSGAKQIRQIDYLPRRMLLDLVRGAKAVLFPSLYEGFGLPALEAIALGVPLLTSATSSLPEVAGAAAIYVDPYDVSAIVTALKRLDGDERLRETLAAAGPVHAERFGAIAYRNRMESLYRSLRA